MTKSQTHLSQQYGWACATLDVDESEPPTRQLQSLLRALADRQFELTPAAIDRFRQELDRFLSRYNSSLDFEQPFE